MTPANPTDGPHRVATLVYDGLSPFEFAIAAEVETLVLFHHEPDRSDSALDEMLSLCHVMVAERGGSVKVIAAPEGMELSL